MKTVYTKKADVENKWYIIDATDKVLGRLAVKIADYLRGKHKASFQPDVECGDSIIVINSAKVKITGKKEKQKKYYHHTGYPGGIRDISYDKAMVKDPTFTLRQAVKGMLPHNKLGRKLMKNLRIYSDDNHEQVAQKPIPLDM